MSEPIPSRIRVRRSPTRGSYDQASLHRVLDRGLIAHVSFCSDSQPYCLPTLYARSGDEVLIHGSSASRMMRLLAVGAPACLTVTMHDGLVLARSAYEHTVNYDSIMLLGRFRALTDEEEKVAALERFMGVLLPGRWTEVRPPSSNELKATMILALAIEEGSVKTRTGPPDDDDSPDGEIEVWAGVIPVLQSFGVPEASPGLKPGIGPSPSVERLISHRPPGLMASAISPRWSRSKDDQ